MKPWDQYKPKEEYPNRNSVVSEYVVERMSALDDIPMTKSQRTKAEKDLEEEAKKYYQEQRQIYHNSLAAARQDFWNDARNDLGYDVFLDEEGMQIIEYKAWEDGHSYGYSEVFSRLKDLSDLVRRLHPHIIADCRFT